MKRITFTLIIPPTGQKRARSRAVDSHSKSFAMTYTDPEQRKEANRLVAMMMEHRPDVPFHGPILLGVMAYFGVPAGRSEKARIAALEGEIRPTKKPDLDNLLKQVQDCGNGVFWVDDKQIVGYMPRTGKYYGDPPRWEIDIVEL